MKVALFLILVLLGSGLQAKPIKAFKSSKDTTISFAKVYQKSDKIKSPSTDPDTARREEKVRQVMRNTKRDGYNLFNHNYGSEKNQLVYLNSLRLDLIDRMINVRRENRKLGLFKVSKEMPLWQIFIGVLIVCLLIFLILLCVSKLGKIKDYIDDIILNSIVEVTTDFLLLSLILTVFSVIALYNVLIAFQMKVNVEQISVAGISFLLLWILSAGIKIWKAQLKVNQWDEKEAQVVNKIEFLKEYAQLNRSGSLNKEQEQRKKVLQSTLRYFNMREDFIDPSFLPAVAENNYRQDYPFSDYLTICLAASLRKYFKFSIWVYLFLVLALVGVIFLNFQPSFVMMLVVPLIFYVFTCLAVVLLRLHISYILSQCTGQLKHEELIEFTQVSGKNEGFKITVFPQFLQEKDSSKMTLLGLQNLQEKLFLFRSPTFTFKLVKFCEILTYFLAIITTPFLFYFWEKFTGFFWVLLLADIVAVALVMSLTPGLLCMYSVATNIVMLRNRKHSRQAVEIQKKYLYKSYISVFRVLKMLNRQTGQATDAEFVRNSINPLHRQQIRTIFTKIAGASNPQGFSEAEDKITITGLRDLGTLVGQNLTEEEWTIIAQESLEDNEVGDMILIEKVIACVEKMADDTKIDPYNLIKDLLTAASRTDEFINEETQKVDLLAFK